MKARCTIAILFVFTGSLDPGTAQEVVATSAEMPIAKSANDVEVNRIVVIALSLGAKASTPAQLVQLTRGLDGPTAAQAFLRVSQEFLRQGKVDIATDVLSHLVKNYPSEPDSTAGALLLLRIYSSSELAHVNLKTNDSIGNLHLPGGWQREQSGNGNLQSTQQSQRKSQELLTYSTHLAGQLVQREPKLAEKPEFAFQSAVIGRLRHRSTEAKSWLTVARNQQQEPRWRLRALAETWLMDQPSTEPPVPVVRSGRSSEVPYLDGILDDSCWQSAARISGSGQPAELFVAHHEKYLYLAGRVPKLPECAYETDNRARFYDADLSGHDRVEIALDMDRDYVSSYRLTIDHRGWTNDSCWLDRSWNPQWHVAATQDDASWAFEAVIAWSELTSIPPQAGEAWVIGARRLSVTTNAEPEATLQLLLFE